ncbi:MAG: MarR family winged helix-turn-helix transcriptional regulator [Solirubrobacteraceae bacterium]
MAVVAGRADARTIIGLLVTSGRGATVRLNQALAGSGLRAREIGALRELEAGPAGQQALAARLRMDPAKLVGLLNGLEGPGLVIRRRSVEDRRRHVVEITDAGRDRLAEAMGTVDAFEESLLAGLEPRQRAELHRMLETITARLATGDPGSADGGEPCDAGGVDSAGCGAG